jgi:serine/threonine-protein kinase
MGAVYRATRLLIGDEVALKVLHSGHVTDPNSAERFRREAQAAARLKHPNAVSIYDFGVSSDGFQYLVMDLVEGRSLRDVTKEQGPLILSLVAAITSQVCAALDEAHRHHIIHRDIKPDNIILNFTSAGLRVKVLDFGIAKLRDDTTSHLTQTGSVMGTPHYMSPEQCLGEELDSRADIYSMGVVLYEMLCGRVPFNSPISTAVVVQQVNQQPPSLRNINPAVPPEVEAVVLRALEKRRDARPASAGALSHELTLVVRATSAGVVSGPILGSPVVASQKPSEFLQEETVERKIGNEAELAQAMPKTVHLAGPRVGSPSLVRRDTEGNSGTATVRLHSSPTRYLRIGLPIIFAGVLIGVMAWFFTSGKREDNSLAHADTAQPPVVAVLQSTNPPESERVSKPVPPPGMVLVNGESFLMGSDEGDLDSKPRHSVEVKPFFIDIYEVTCEDYKKFVDSGHVAPKTWVNGDYPAGSAKHPVTSVSWEDAVAYAQWAGKRLPTEEEWEFAARGKRGLLYPWGNKWKPGCANADNTRSGLSDVGSYECASPFGVQDLIGNAWEWTASNWIAYPGGRLANQPSGPQKVIRGGTWESRPEEAATATYRVGFGEPGDQTGFRCAKDPN